MNHQHEYFDPLPFSVENQQCEEYSNDYTGKHGANGTVCNTRTTQLIYISGHTQQTLTPLTQLLSRGRGKGGGYAIAGVIAYSETTPANCFKYNFFLRGKVKITFFFFTPPPNLTCTRTKVVKDFSEN